MKWTDFLGKKKYTKEELDEISRKARRGLYSWQTVYNAFIDAGLSPEEAKEETDKRVMLLD